jgi:hypothetical protein
MCIVSNKGHLEYGMTAFNKNVDIKFSAHDAFLELSSSGMLKIEILETQII